MRDVPKTEYLHLHTEIISRKQSLHLLKNIRAFDIPVDKAKQLFSFVVAEMGDPI